MLCSKIKEDDVGFGYMSSSVESRLLLKSKGGCTPSVCENVCEEKEVGSGYSSVRCSKVKVKDEVLDKDEGKKMKLNDGFGYLSNSIESRLLLKSKGGCRPSVSENVCEIEEDDDSTAELDVLLDLCGEEKENDSGGNVGFGEFVSCPMCGIDISDMCDEMRQVHTNECLDKEQVNLSCSCVA